MMSITPIFVNIFIQRNNDEINTKNNYYLLYTFVIY